MALTYFLRNSTSYRNGVGTIFILYIFIYYFLKSYVKVEVQFFTKYWAAPKTNSITITKQFRIFRTLKNKGTLFKWDISALIARTKEYVLKTNSCILFTMRSAKHFRVPFSHPYVCGFFFFYYIFNNIISLVSFHLFSIIFSFIFPPTLEIIKQRVSISSLYFWKRHFSILIHICLIFVLYILINVFAQVKLFCCQVTTVGSTLCYAIVFNRFPHSFIKIIETLFYILRTSMYTYGLFYAYLL